MLEYFILVKHEIIIQDYIIIIFKMSTGDEGVLYRRHATVDNLDCLS